MRDCRADRTARGVGHPACRTPRTPRQPTAATRSSERLNRAADRAAQRAARRHARRAGALRLPARRARSSSASTTSTPSSATSTSSRCSLRPPRRPSSSRPTRLPPHRCSSEGTRRRTSSSIGTRQFVCGHRRSGGGDDRRGPARDRRALPGDDRRSSSWSAVAALFGWLWFGIGLVGGEWQPMSSPAAILDIDGTLVDSNYHHAIAWYRALRQHDQRVAIWRIHRHIGMGGDQLVASLFGDEVEERAGRRHPRRREGALHGAHRRGRAAARRARR